jgi:hypothetical protein
VAFVVHHWSTKTHTFKSFEPTLKKTAARTITALWAAIADAIPLIKPDECANYFNACGYDCG